MSFHLKQILGRQGQQNEGKQSYGSISSTSSSLEEDGHVLKNTALSADYCQIVGKSGRIQEIQKMIAMLFLFTSFVLAYVYTPSQVGTPQLEMGVIKSTSLGPLAGMIKSTEQFALRRDKAHRPRPFSTKNPVKDLEVHSFNRPDFSKPQKVFGKLHKGQGSTGFSLPTNSWYENMILVKDEMAGPTMEQCAYTVPYFVNAVGPIPGLKINPTRLLAMDKVVQVTYIDDHGLTLGAAGSFTSENVEEASMMVDKRYVVDYGNNIRKDRSPLSPLGLTLKWHGTDGAKTNSTSFEKMASTIVRGMPYGTMHYHYKASDIGFSSVYPTVISELGIVTHLSADSDEKVIICGKDSQSDDGEEVLVKKFVTVSFLQSEFTWLIFYSHPVYVRCYKSEEGVSKFILQATRLQDTSDEKHNLGDELIFTSRVALMNNCTYGGNPSYCQAGKPHDKKEFGDLLKKHADIYPGKHTNIDYTFFTEERDGGEEYSYIQFDWDSRHVRTEKRSNHDDELLMYSLPHHREMLHPQATSSNSATFDGVTHCSPSLNGEACLIAGGTWVLKEDLLDGEPSFNAPRLPKASALPNLAKAINEDILFRLPSYYQRGAGDTYFSGKMLAKLSRILLVTQELIDICNGSIGDTTLYAEYCHQLTLPGPEKFDEALDHLRSCTEVWINGTAETPFVYDTQWGGLASCGCNFNGETQSCDNAFPNCPGFYDPGMDFGHAFYNDHHFHHGYHIYAAATIAHFDKGWGRKHFENVLLLIRDIANPSSNDIFFPEFRMKDWYLGNSWAGGIARAYPNGRNQESSSESIAAYEAIALYGLAMSQAWSDSSGEGSDEAATSRHIKDVGRLLTATELRAADRYWHVRHTGPKSGIYPKQYTPKVVGMLWNMMAEFQTWFGSAPHLAYGIQLLPLTAISERRDDIDWSKELYPSFAESCRTAKNCDEEGWGILQHAVLATVGHIDKAIDYAEGLPTEAFTSAGGNGHSRTNSIWYYATRPWTRKLELPKVRTPSPSPQGGDLENDGSICPPCTKEVCESEQLNKCPVLDAPYLCTSGNNLGGCSMVPWNLGMTGGANCNECCRVTYECA